MSVAIEPPRCGIAEAPRLAAYAARLHEVVRNWSSIAQMPSGASFDDAIAGAVRDRGTLRTNAARLCADGSPVELVERLGTRPFGPAITCETPFSRARFRGAALSGLPAAASVAGPAIGSLFENVPSAANPALWVGVQTVARGDVETTVYCSLDGRVAGDCAARCVRAFEHVSKHSARAVRQVINLMQGCGYLRLVGLTFGPHGFNGIKLYARYDRVTLDRLRAVSASAGVSGAPFDRYVRRILRRPRTWFDARAGVGVALDAHGTPVGAALYHYPHGYFATDESLRTRLLESAGEFGWDPSLYRPMSRLIDADDGSRVRSLLAFGVSITQESRFNAYARTGHFAA